jgi:hypothetical protein
MTEKLHMGDLVGWACDVGSVNKYEWATGVIIRDFGGTGVFLVRWNNGKKLYASQSQLTLRARAKQ